MGKLYRAIARSMTGTLSLYIVQFLTLAIYARLFNPIEFGTLASIQVFLLFFQILSDVGLGPAIVSLKSVSQKLRDAVFSFSIILGLLFSILFYFFSFLLDDFYNNDYRDISIILVVTIFFNTISSLLIASFQKDTKFIRLAVVGVGCELTAFVGVFTLWFYNYSELALAFKGTIFALTKFFVLYILSKDTSIGQPRITKEIHYVKEILSFSIYQMSYNFVNFFSRNLDNILIGKFFGVSTLAGYEKSYQLMRYPLMLTSFAINPAIQPVLANEKRKKIVVDAQIDISEKLLIISIPVSFILYTNSYNIIFLFFGYQWLEFTEVVEVFSLMIPFQAVLSSSGAFYHVMNKPKMLFYSGCISAFFNITAIIFGVWNGSVLDVARSLCLSFIISYFTIYLILYKYCFKDDFLKFLIEQSKVALLSILPMLFYMNVQNNFISYIDGELYQLILGVVTITALYLPFLFFYQKVAKSN